MKLVATPRYSGTPLELSFKLELIDKCLTTKFTKQQIPNIEIMRQSSTYSSLYR